MVTRPPSLLFNQIQILIITDSMSTDRCSALLVTVDVFYILYFIFTIFIYIYIYIQFLFFNISPKKDRKLSMHFKLLHWGLSTKYTKIKCLRNILDLQCSDLDYIPETIM